MTTTATAIAAANGAREPKRLKTIAASGLDASRTMRLALSNTPIRIPAESPHAPGFDGITAYSIESPRSAAATAPPAAKMGRFAAAREGRLTGRQ